MRALPGSPFPLGATWDGQGVNFALFSERAERVELCLFKPGAKRETHRIKILEHTNMVWHAYIAGLEPGQLYGYRVYGPYEPENGLRFNPNKVLLDPYAKAIGRPLKWADELFGYRIGDEREDLSFDDRDSAPYAPLAAVIAPSYEWRDDIRPNHPWHRTLIYETHVKGLTHRHPDVPEKLRGTYAGVASEPMLKHYKEMCITAVELMPVHAFVDDRHLCEAGRSNYWGYNTLGFLAPDHRYSSADTPAGVVQEFKDMVKALHAANIEVILDVVYNHTAEGNHMGPTLSLRGIDNTSFYRVMPDQARYYMDYTGCGNTLNALHPKALQLIMDSLRYWAIEMRVDGFRFDLASALAREFHSVSKLGAFFDIIAQDPVLSTMKLIAEPWDLGEGGYQVGNFPVGWAEWNGKYRDSVRRFWRGEEGAMSELATRLCGSSDLYEFNGRRPSASINFVTAHDGFTLNDLVACEWHPEGEDKERNGGSESTDPGLRKLWEQQKRNLIATVLLSQGIPMISGGDEIGRTQRCCDNAYDQDSEITWYDWKLDAERSQLLDFVRRLARFRRDHPALCRRKFFQGRPIHGSGISDIAWIRADGREMTEAEWSANWVRALAVRLDGMSTDVVDVRGEPVTDDTLLIILNGHEEEVKFYLGGQATDADWLIEFDTSDPALEPGIRHVKADGAIPVQGRSLLLLRHGNDPAEGQKMARKLDEQVEEIRDEGKENA